MHSRISCTALAPPKFPWALFVFCFTFKHRKAPVCSGEHLDDLGRTLSTQEEPSRSGIYFRRLCLRKAICLSRVCRPRMEPGFLQERGTCHQMSLQPARRSADEPRLPLTSGCSPSLCTGSTSRPVCVACVWSMCIVCVVCVCSVCILWGCTHVYTVFFVCVQRVVCMQRVQCVVCV